MQDLSERVWKAREGVFGWKRDEEGSGVAGSAGDEAQSQSQSQDGLAMGTGTAATTTNTNDGARIGTSGSKRKQRQPILLSEDVLDQFSMGQKALASNGVSAPASASGGNTTFSRAGTSANGAGRATPNSHLSLLAMVDCWWKLGINPFEHLDVAGTPPFMLWIG
jgi:prephenate dehydrogenase (NADP+)